MGRPRIRGCGTPAAVRRHQRRKEKLDQACEKAQALAWQERKQRLGYVWFQPARTYVKTSEQ